MNRKEAREFLLEIANSLGTMGIEKYSDKDGNKAIEAINVLYYNFVDHFRKDE